MAGPTGMGMAKLISDNGGLEEGNEKYSFTKYADTNAAKSDLAAGKIDAICLPTNEAALYYVTQGKNVQVLAINCLNPLYLLSDKANEVKSLASLNGETIYTCKNGTPRVILEHLIVKLGLDVKVCYEYDGKEIVTPQDLSALVVLGKLPNAVMPEPLVTSSLLSIAKNTDSSISYTVYVDLADEWATISDDPITMGCILADGDFVNANKSRIDSFLDEYKLSVEYMSNPENLDSAANYIYETGVMAAVPAAKKALSNLGSAISYIDGDDMRWALINFYAVLNIRLPDDEFHYAK
jgi:NitT/TauT family transport system substrate-binding protein